MGTILGSIILPFMIFASYSTVHCSLLKNITACIRDLTGWSRSKTIYINIVLITLLSMPCILGFNVWSHISR